MLFLEAFPVLRAVCGGASCVSKAVDPFPRACSSVQALQQHLWPLQPLPSAGQQPCRQPCIRDDPGHCHHLYYPVSHVWLSGCCTQPLPPACTEGGEDQRSCWPAAAAAHGSPVLPWREAAALSSTLAGLNTRCWPAHLIHPILKDEPRGACPFPSLPAPQGPFCPKPTLCIAF